MGTFLNTERIRQADLKGSTALFSPEARGDGVYKNKPRPFCLPLSHAEENLFPGIRKGAMEYFDVVGIKWHDGKSGKPSNHLCDSQVCCVNFLFPFASEPAALVQLLSPHYPLRDMVPMEPEGGYVSFEWIGERNYLGERQPTNGKRTRGANCTSADAAVMFDRTDGLRQIVLIEWKYTESYAVARGNMPLKVSKSGTDRTEIYRPLWDAEDCPVERELLPSFDDLFVEPFYQFMRQQLLANEMEKANELGADIVTLLHLCPATNRDFRTVTSPRLADLGDTATDVWKRLVKKEAAFLSLSVEELFGQVLVPARTELGSWSRYIRSRYLWATSEEDRVRLVKANAALGRQ